MTNKRNSTLLAFVKSQIEQRGAIHVGLHNLDKLRTTIEQYIENCCLLPLRPLSNSFLTTSHQILSEMTGRPIKHKLQPVLRLLNSILNCCPQYFNGARFSLTVDNREGDADITNFTIGGSDQPFEMYVDFGDGTPIQYFNGSNSYTLNHEYIKEGEFTIYINITGVENVNFIDNNGSANVTNILNIQLLTNLQFLDLSDSNLEEFDPVIALPDSLLNLNLSNTNLTTFNPTIELPQTLEVLELADNNLTSFALTSTMPPTINILNLGGNNLDVTAVNNALVYINGQTFNAGTKELIITQSTPAAPTGAGATAVTALEGEGWTVTSD